MEKLRVDIWSDIACPWCYVGKRRFEAALARFEAKGDVEVVWRAFELDPSAPRVRIGQGSHAERIAKKYGMTVAMAEQRTAQLVEVAKEDGLDMRFDRIRSGNTFDAHRVVHLGRSRGLQDAVKERLLLGYFTEGEPIGDVATLVRLGADAGLDADEVAGVLAGDRFTREVRDDEALARELGITGVPFFVLGGKYAISGAQPADAILGVLRRASADSRPAEIQPEGAACGPGGCG